jgi:hypothetical protein
MTQTKIGTCEVCDTHELSITVHYGNMWFCDDCWTKEEKSTVVHMSPEAQQARVDAANEFYNQRTAKMKVGSDNAAAIPINEVLQASRKIDSSIQVRTDIFNASTIAIIELKKAIDEDATITNKPFALASELKTRYEHFKNVVFELQQKVVDAASEQRAIQTYMNTLANQLRAEEREKLKLSDINYKPSPPKIAKPKTIKTTGSKVDKKELRKVAQELGVSEVTLKMMVVATGKTISEAAAAIRAMANKG